MRSGFLLLKKHAGCSSAQLLNQVKRQLSPVKLGHTGTLDPFATGLLVAVVNKATSLARFVEGFTKTYSGVIRLGLVTDTDDVTGKELQSSQDLPNFASVLEASRAFSGEIEQQPPLYSALKVNGERAYALMRRGEVPELKARQVRIDSFEVEEIEAGRIRFRLVCSRGTYVRSIARDIGEMLGCGACVEELSRDAVGPFSLENAKDPQRILEDDILPCEIIFPEALRVQVDRQDALRLQHGDERVLKSLLLKQTDEKLHRSSAILYSSALSSRVSGILLREGERWRFGVNFQE